METEEPPNLQDGSNARERPVALGWGNSQLNESRPNWPSSLAEPAAGWNSRLFRKHKLAAYNWSYRAPQPLMDGRYFCRLTAKDIAEPAALQAATINSGEVRERINSRDLLTGAGWLMLGYILLTAVHRDYHGRPPGGVWQRDKEEATADSDDLWRRLWRSSLDLAAVLDCKRLNGAKNSQDAEDGDPADNRVCRERCRPSHRRRWATLSRSYTLPPGERGVREIQHGRLEEEQHTANFGVSEKERAEAERLRAEAWRTVRSTDQRTKARQSDASKRLNERLEDIQFWRRELQKESQLNHNESENLSEHLRVLENALQHTAKPLKISEECLMNREKRIGIDQEVEVIKRCQGDMQKLIDKAKVQLKLNRAALHEIDKDVKHKSHAREIDDRMYTCETTPLAIAYHPPASRQWTRESAEPPLRSCAAASTPCCVPAPTVGVSLARVNNGAELATMGEIFDVDRSIALLRKAIADKEAPMKVAQTRLEERTRRLDIEICNDPAMNTLQREVCEIRDSIRALKDKLRAAEAALSRLNKTKGLLESDIAVKEKLHPIDAKYCLGMRKTFPMDPKVGPIFSMPMA
uniref:Tektin n=1 Tax=Macrostomum lignano TaxID=282301 RepID=A0A1I8FNY4_9PLAT